MLYFSCAKDIWDKKYIERDWQGAYERVFILDDYADDNEREKKPNFDTLDMLNAFDIEHEDVEWDGELWTYIISNLQGIMR